MAEPPRLYGELASWFHLLTRPESYAEEAEFAIPLLGEAAAPPPRTLLELGAGGGNSAFHLKTHFQMTLTDLSAEMLENSRRINPECEHLVGDMRSLRLGRLFDAVFVHDAIMYMTTEDDLRLAIETAAAHCRQGGVALLLPDCVRETFTSGVHHQGGYDGGGRSLRYLEWTIDADPTDTIYTADYAYMLREGDGPVRVEHDRHTLGIFARDTWMALMRGAGFTPRVLSDPWNREVFVGTRS